MDINRIAERIAEYRANNDLNMFAAANDKVKDGLSNKMKEPLQYPLTRFF